MLSTCVTAPAKINIGLSVLSGTTDGYHNIESIFQTVSLADMIRVESVSEQNCCLVECDNMVLPAENTITAAYRAFCAQTGIRCGVRVLVEKLIPDGAGLGGGSSDAAFFIKALNTLFETNLPHGVYEQIAAAVGSDVFFFLSCDSHGSGCAVVSGRGEKVRRITPRQDLFFVLIYPDVHSSTAEAYRLVDAYYAHTPRPAGLAADALDQMYYQAATSWRFVNDFAAPLIQKYPRIGEALDDIALQGALFTQMSGSGSAVFGVFNSEAEAQNASFQLRNKWAKCYALSTI